MLSSAEEKPSNLVGTIGEAAGVSKGGCDWLVSPLWLSSLVTFLFSDKKVTIPFLAETRKEHNEFPLFLLVKWKNMC